MTTHSDRHDTTSKKGTTLDNNTPAPTPLRTLEERYADTVAAQRVARIARWEASQPADQTGEDYMFAFESRVLWD